jgi:hypothetical protein
LFPRKSATMQGSPSTIGRALPRLQSVFGQVPKGPNL